MIRKYSQLRVAGKYDFPRRSDKPLYPYQEYRQKIQDVLKEQNDLVKQKLLPKGGLVPLKTPGSFMIVSKEPTDNTQWRVTRFTTEKGERIPVGHLLCKDLTEGNPLDTVRGVISSDVDWDTWERQT